MQTIINIERKTIRSLAVAVTPMGLGQTAVLVYLPLLVTHTGIGYSQWAQLLALGMAAYLAGILVWPLLLPRLGYPLALRLGLAGYGASMLLLAAALAGVWGNHLDREAAMVGVALSRLLYGGFASILLPVVQSWCADLTHADQRLRAFSQISLQLALSRALGPALAALLGWLHWLLLPLALALWPLLLMGRVWHLPAPPDPDPPQHWRRHLRGVIPPRWLGLLALATTAIGSSLQFQLGPALEQLSDLPPRSLSLFLGALMVAAAALSVGAHRLQIRRPPVQPQLRKLWLAALLLVSALGLLYARSLWQFCGIVLVMSLALAWMTPLYSSQLSLLQQRQNLAAAQLGVTHILGHLSGLSVTALALRHSLHCVYIWLTMLAAVCLVAALSWRPLQPAPGASASQ